MRTRKPSPDCSNPSAPRSKALWCSRQRASPLDTSIRAIVGVPLDVGGFQSERPAVDPDVEVTDRTALIVFPQHVDPESGVAFPPEDFSNLSAPGESCEVQPRPDQWSARRLSDLAVEREWEVLVQEELDGLRNKLGIRLEKLLQVFRETTVDVPFSQLTDQQVAARGCRQERAPGDLPQPIASESAEGENRMDDSSRGTESAQ